jgi:hypothetical protein
MEEKKLLTINPELFSFTNNTTRKKKKTDNNENKIKYKNNENIRKQERNSLKKRSILRMIRENQEERYRKLFEEKRNNSIHKNNSDNHSNKFNKDFNEAQQFLSNLTKKKEETDKLKNFSIKQYPKREPNSLLYHNISEPLSEVNVNLTHQGNSNSIHLKPKTELEVPKYGCLKGGNLPTYRNYVNRTVNNRPYSNFPSNNINPQIVIDNNQNQSNLSSQILNNSMLQSFNHVLKY